MKPLSVVVAQQSPEHSQHLANSLNHHFRSVNVARDLEALRHSVSKNRADVAIIDLELARLRDVQQLKREFSQLTIVCTHRVADEQMWSDALAAGASDCCCTSDVRAIVLAASQTKPLSHAHAA